MNTFAPIHVGQFYAETPEQHAWVLDGYLARGALTALTAYPKVGKSTWVYALIAAVAHGKMFMGRAVAGGPVLVLAVEEHPVDVRLRLKKFGITDQDSIYIHAVNLVPDAETLKAIADFIVSHGIVLLVLDTIAHVWDVTDENHTMQVKAAVKIWLDLVRQTLAAGVLVHHEGKTEQSGGRSLRGASSFAGIVDQILTLRPRAGTRRVLQSDGRYEQTPRELLLELAGSDYHVVTGSSTKPTNLDKVLVFLKSQPEGIATYTAIVKGTGLAESSVIAALNQAKAKELATNDGGPWALTPLGQVWGIEAVHA